MADIKIKTTKKVVPMIYAYSTPEIARHNGWTKIGYTEQDVDKRLSQQTHTADIEYKEEWRGSATYDDGSGDTFSDKDFHRYLRKRGIEQEEGKSNEWFHIDGQASKIEFYDFRSNRGVLETSDMVISYVLRNEQADAAQRAKDYFELHENGEFLYNAKPRFGKTLTVYDLCKQLDATNVLVVTNRPAIANSWYNDYAKFLGRESGYFFVSHVDSIKNKPYVTTYSAYEKTVKKNGMNHQYKMIYFVSLQDLKGAQSFGGDNPKLQEIAYIDWDILVIDEAHEGVDTFKTDVAFDHIKRKHTLHLSGTPFKALANDKFSESAIYNWTYADEQRAKRDWNEDGENPYANLPQLNMFTYQMSEIIKDELEQGIEINGETEEYAFDLNEFFETKNGKFVHDSSVDKFLDAMTTQPKFPFSTDELRNELKHTFWLLNRVDSASALAKKLRNHDVFKDYFVIFAAGDGKLDDTDETKKSYDKVVDAISKYEKTITLSVGQLTTGVTIPEWTAVLMLSSMKSPALYMQAAFRAQNPCLFSEKGKFYRKKNAYVFDFDPARTLTIFERFANDLNAETSEGRGVHDKRTENVRELLNFFPVIGEDANGEMIELDAEQVLVIPRKIRSQEVVRRGFMSDFLFRNVSNVFRAPTEVIDIINQLEPVHEPKGNKVEVDDNTSDDLSLNENGDVVLPDEYIIGQTADVFGDKIYDIGTQLDDAIADIYDKQEEQSDPLEDLKKIFQKEAVTPIIEQAQKKYMDDIKPADKKRLERKLQTDADMLVKRVCGDFSIQNNLLEQERQELLQECKDADEVREINDAYNAQKKDVFDNFRQALADVGEQFIESASQDIVKTVETSKREQEKNHIEGSIKDHLRGFSRTIPSFLMAYGEDGDEIKLDTFDTIIPDEVFKEVTSITLDQFRVLRDGNHLFDQVVFNDSVKEFLRLKKKLADYFDETATEDIFDYIPPQKTNQIFTPKAVVKKMVDMLEEENPGCFDMPGKTFIDMYMKSGLYITEIVKRLYQSEKMKSLYPDGEARLKHIFEEQVYGLAPTEIIYRIATNFILGFDEDVKIQKHNFRQVDALPFAKDGTLQQKLDEIFGK